MDNTITRGLKVLVYYIILALYYPPSSALFFSTFSKRALQSYVVGL